MEIHTFFKFRYLKCTLNENPVEILQILTLFTVYLADGFIIQKGKNIVKRFIDNVLFYFLPFLSKHFLSICFLYRSILKNNCPWHFLSLFSFFSIYDIIRSGRDECS